MNDNRWSRAGALLWLCLVASSALLIAAPAGAQALPQACASWYNTGTFAGHPQSLTDTEASYYGTLVYPTQTPAPGTRIRIDGHFPSARNFSFTAYWDFGPILDSKTDYEIAPDAGSQSAYIDQAHIDPAVPAGGNYTVYVEFSPIPDNPQPNTIYIDPAKVKGGVSMIVYRIYLPNVDHAGGVDLPKLTVETPDGDVAAQDYPYCKAWGATTSLIQFGLEDIATNIGLFSFLPAADPTFYVYHTIPGNPLEALNGDNKYLWAIIDDAKGDMVLMRGKAPYYATQPDVDPQVRHWSICENSAEFLTYSCVEDHSAAIDRRGYYNVVISPDDRKPANATHDYGFDWMGYGSKPTPKEGLIVYRQLLADPGYKQAIANIPSGKSAKRSMGTYYPEITYCASDVFNVHTLAHESPARVFAACQAGH
jgi:hypothetical protein